MGIVGIVLGAIWVAASPVYTNNKVRIATQQLVATAHNIRTIFAEQGGVTDTGGGALTKALDQLKAFPLDMRQNQAIPTGTVFHAWSSQANNGLGSVAIDADNCAGAPNTAGASQPCFGVTFYDIPQNACTLLVGETSQPGAGLQQILVNSVVAGDAGGTPLPPLPVPASTAKTVCNNNGSTAGTNDILWIYSVKGSGS